jgi:hypothetical protein
MHIFQSVVGEAREVEFIVVLACDFII